MDALLQLKQVKGSINVFLNPLIIGFRRLLFILILCYVPSLSIAKQQTSSRTITVSISPSELYAGQDLSLSFHIDNADSVYYFGLELAYESNMLSFKTGTAGSLMGSNALEVANNLSPDTLGASVSRTNGTSFGNGVLLQLTFHIPNNAAPGPLEFKLSSLDLRDSTGNSLPVQYTSTIDTSITASITNARLTFDSDSVYFTHSLTIKSETLSRSITDNTGAGSGIKAWIGVSKNNTDPSSWNDTSWVTATYSNDDGSYDVYQVSVGEALSPGTYYIASRFQLNNQAYVYGGYSTSGGGIWKADSNRSGLLVILPYRTQLVAWNFDDDNLIADKGIKANRQDTLRLIGAQTEGWITGAEGDAFNTSGWDDSTQDEYYEIHLSTAYYKNIRLFSKQSGSNSGPRDFTVEYSTDNSSWKTINNGSITVDGNWTSGVLSGLKLPADASNQQDLYIRWRKTSEIQVAGNTGISSRGTSHIDDIIITGVDSNPATLTVWPGDTNNDGIVDQTDVLPLGNNWMLSGPPRPASTAGWKGEKSTGWRPGNVTYADADGNGTVNEADLFPVGKYFNKSHTINRLNVKSQRSLTYQDWPDLQPGDKVLITIMVKKQIAIKGISFNYNLENTEGKRMNIPAPDIGSWAQKWIRHHQMMKFNHSGNNGSAIAWVYEGQALPVNTKKLFSFTITIRDQNFKNARLEIHKLAVLGDHIHLLSPDSMAISVKIDHPLSIDEHNHIIRHTRLDANYPNPFNPTTNIRYKLARKEKVKVIIYDLLGRQVERLVNKVQSPGKYTITWDAGKYASGIYFYRLQTKDYVKTRKMMLIK
jgi:hypothetical protein